MVLVTIVFGFISLFCLVGCVFNLKRQYRYATLLYDMLPLYPVLSTFGFIFYVLTVLQIGLPLFIQLPLIIPGFLSFAFIFYRSFRWFNSYRMSKYEAFLKELQDPKYSVKLHSEYKDTLGKDDPEFIHVFIRHDVDIYLHRLKRMVALEKKYNVKSTVFFRLHAERYKFDSAIPIIEDIKQAGFEIGYHYEVLARTNGKKEPAIVLFEKELAYLRTLAPINYVVAHGDKYDNGQIFKELDKDKLKIESSYNFKNCLYLSEAGGNDMFAKYNKHIFSFFKSAKKGDVIQILIHADWWY